MAHRHHPARRSPAQVEGPLDHTLDRRTLLSGAARAAAGLWVVGSIGGLASACGGGEESTTGTSGAGANTLPATVNVGVIAPMSGFGQFVGEQTERGLQAAVQHLSSADVLPGTTVEYEIVNAPVEDGAQGAVNAYNQLAADPAVIGILWATPPGIQEAATQIERDSMPVMLVSTDLVSSGWDFADAPTVYQFLPPNRWLMEAMCRYAGEDRGYTTTALMLDTSVFLAENRAAFVEFAEASGMEVVGVEEFNVMTSDFGAQLQRLKDAAPQNLHIWGLNDNVALISKSLAELDARYIDTPTAKSGGGWHPHILGYPGGFQPKWAELAGDAAAPYSIAAWYLGGSLQAPEITPINQWVIDTTGEAPEGGEELAANGLWALLEAARRAGSIDREAIAEKLPGLRATFATLPFTLDADTHVALTTDDIVLTVRELTAAPADTDPPYVLGTDVTSPDPRAPRTGGSLSPTLLLRPTLEANRRAQPDYMSYLLEKGMCTQCTKTPPDATGGDIEMTDDCRIH